MICHFFVDLSRKIRDILNNNNNNRKTPKENLKFVSANFIFLKKRSNLNYLNFYFQPVKKNWPIKLLIKFSLSNLLVCFFSRLFNQSSSIHFSRKFSNIQRLEHCKILFSLKWKNFFVKIQCKYNRISCCNLWSFVFNIIIISFSCSLLLKIA